MVSRAGVSIIGPSSEQMQMVFPVICRLFEASPWEATLNFMSEPRLMGVLG